MGFFKFKSEDSDFEDLRASLRIGNSLGTVYNAGATIDVSCTTFPEHDRTRFMAVKNFGHHSFPVFIEFDHESEYKNAIKVRYKSFHLGWVKKTDTKEIIEILNSNKVVKSIAGSAYLVDLGPRSSSEYGQTRLELYALAKPFVDKPQLFTHEVKVKSATELKRHEEKQKINKDIGDEGKQKLKSGTWEVIKLQPGDSIYFTGFGVERSSLEKAAVTSGLMLSNGVNKKLKLLVVNEDYLEDSAKVQSALVKGIPVTNLETYLLANPELRPEQL
jgi:hypothetical protein